MNSTSQRSRVAIFACILLATASVTLAQRGRFAGRGGRNRGQSVRSDYPTWEIDQEFKFDGFTFARIQFDSAGGRGGQSWQNDYPDCDWNFSLRLHQLTSMPVDPNGKVLRLTDPSLVDYPFIYLTNAQTMWLAEDEVTSLRHYLLNGGFMMADDIWAADARRHIFSVMSQVFPDRQPEELPLSHEIFHLVYDLKEIPQVPSILAWRDGDEVENWHGSFEGDDAAHFYGYHDDSGRLMALICHNNDIGDGWEREGDNKEYFERYSVKISYPLGINIVTYAMTH